MAGADPGRRTKLLATAATSLLVILGLLALQRSFDEGDARRALEWLDVRAPGGGRSVREELAARGGAPPACQAKTTSSCAGTLELSCSAGPGAPYRFSVDLLRRRVAPLDARAAEVMDAAQRAATSRPVTPAPSPAMHPPLDGGAEPVHP